jgi:hypothetical protein
MIWIGHMKTTLQQAFWRINRIVLILLLLPLLQAQGALPEKPKIPERPKLQVEAMDWIFCPEAELYRLENKRQYGLYDEQEYATQVDGCESEVILKSWSEGEGIKPYRIRLRLKLKNFDQNTLPVFWRIDAKFGDRLVEQETQIIDFKTLKKTERLENITQGVFKSAQAEWLYSPVIDFRNKLKNRRFKGLTQLEASVQVGQVRLLKRLPIETPHQATEDIFGW